MIEKKGICARVVLAGALLLGTFNSAHAGNMTFTLIDTGGAGTGTKAYAGFKAATDYWSSVLVTKGGNVNIVLDIGFNSLGNGILGSTGSSVATAPIFSVESQLAAVSSGNWLDAKAVADLPKLYDGIFGSNTALKVYTPGYTDPVAKTGIDNSTKVFDADGGFNNSVIGVNTANAKALGYAINPATVDGSVSFNSDYSDAFDFNPGDGIAASHIDFVGVAIHEIGHALGFVSGVDDYDFVGTGGPIADLPCLQDGTLCKDYPANDTWWGYTLDLFRYSGKGQLDWTTGTDSYFSIDGGKSTVSSNGYFSTGAFNGDGWQASHWAAPINSAGNFTCALPFEGVMNPYLCNGSNAVITGEDLDAFDAIGYNLAEGIIAEQYSFSTTSITVSVPEVGTWAMMIAGFGLVGAAARRAKATRIGTI